MNKELIAKCAIITAGLTISTLATNLVSVATRAYLIRKRNKENS